MDNSDEELFNPSPSCSKSIVNTSLNLAMKETNDLVQDSIKERDCQNCLVKDISVKLTRLSNTKIKNGKPVTFFNKNKYINNKRKYKLWKFGNVQKRKKTSKKHSTQQILEKEKGPITEITMESKIDDNTYARLCEQPQKIVEESCVATQRAVQNAQENAEDFTLLTHEAQNKKEVLCDDKTYMCARILPYEFHQKKNTSSNSTIDAVARYNFSSSSLSSSETTEQNLNTDKICVFKCTLSKDKERSMKRLVHERLKSRKFAIQGELNEWKSKKKRSLSVSSEEPRPRRKRCRRISSDLSDDNETAVERSMEITGIDNQNKSHSSYERMDQEKSRPNIQINHEACITLMRLEQMDDMDVIKWRASRIRNALEMIQSQSVKKQLDKQKQAALKHQRNEIISLDGCQKHNLSETQNNHQDLSQLSIVSSTPVEKHCSVRLNNERLNMIKLRKKYKLFKKPRVLIIKLETLKNSSENGKYSAIEIDRLTKKYINFVISSTSSSKSRESLLYGFAHLQKKSMTDVNVTRTENDKTSYNLSGEQSVNKSSKQSDIDGSSVRGTTLFQILLRYI